MPQVSFHNSLLNILFLTLALGFASDAFSDDIPGAADAARVGERRDIVAPPSSATAILPTSPTLTQSPIPDQAKSIAFVLHSVTFKGVTTFSDNQLSELYQEWIGKQVTLDVVWVIAQRLTDLYHKEGYFLSRSFVPAQAIEGGNITIEAVEGYIGKVTLQGDVGMVVDDIIAQITSEKPATIRHVESQLLRLNDLPGASFRSLLQPLASQTDAATELVLMPQKKAAKTSISFDNYGSSYLGPNQATLSYLSAFLPYQQTIFSTLASTPMNELKYCSISHQIPLTSTLQFQLTAGYTDASPGGTLRARNIESISSNVSSIVQYKPIRQRGENLSFSTSFDVKNTDSDIRQTRLTRDRIRALRLAATYDKTDSWRGYNFITLTVSKGLDMFSSTHAGERNLSRAEAEPDFYKTEFYVSRLQGFSDDWGALFSVAGQYSHQPLYSSEEFGYGGQNFGRAYDASEITGDSGVNGAIELRYYGFHSSDILTPLPYVFYDAGKVWNRDIGSDPLSASSVGFGLRVTTSKGLAANLAFATPLTKEMDAPQSWHGGKSRVSFQLTYGF
ncbi:MAG: ShlB/FhaC/HecB family hemolysin secretion/activation protein [Alphaproteobacteria bacterium]|nr:ShlB/FhaC/HecB family hemolysin secretion/activation protein [Alphaproteobacteria bacterium]